MNQAAFQLNKVRRLIKTSGKVFEFKTRGTNEFGEPNGEPVARQVKGVFHESPGCASGYVTKTSSDATTTRMKSQPMILTLWESVSDLKHGSELKFNGKTYKVNEVTNISQANLVADISLEEVQT